MHSMRLVTMDLIYVDSYPIYFSKTNFCLICIRYPFLIFTIDLYIGNAINGDQIARYPLEHSDSPSNQERKTSLIINLINHLS